MTLKPSYLRAFIKTFLCFCVFIAVVSGIIPYFQGKPVQAGDILGEAGFGAVFFGIFVALAFTPREITWNDDTITIRTLFPGSVDFEWR